MDGQGSVALISSEALKVIPTGLGKVKFVLVEGLGVGQYVP